MKSVAEGRSAHVQGRRRLGRRWLIAGATAALLVCVAGGSAALIVAGLLYEVYFDRQQLPDPGPLERFEFPVIGHVYDTNGQPIIELAYEHRQIIQFAEIPTVVREAILAAEDKSFFSHDGVDYRSIPRVIGKMRARALLQRLTARGRRANAGGPAIFPQGGSTITQQLVRGFFLRDLTSRENSSRLISTGVGPRLMALVVGPRNANKLIRKCEEIRLSLWLEKEMTARFGSKRRAKEEILARYASFVYMGNGQYGFARAAEVYFGRPLSSFTSDDVDKAAMLAGIAKAPRDYAPTLRNRAAVQRRRNQTLTLMAAVGSISMDQQADAVQRTLPDFGPRAEGPFRSAAVVGHVLADLSATHADLSIHDLLQGRLQVYTTVDERIQRIVCDALERGLERYEKRHPSATGVVQGSVVVLRNRDGGVLAETGGRQVFLGRSTVYSDFNRVTQSLRQPGSAMKPILYLAAFRHGDFTLETVVPDEPIAVFTGWDTPPKWIENYDGQFKGPIPVREALAESRNAVAIWIASRIGIDAVLRTARSLGVETPLQRYPTTALGASEVNLLELATAYRTIASGVVAKPYLIQRIVAYGEDLPVDPRRDEPKPMNDQVLSLIQEGLRGVVRIPTGTAHVLDSRAFPLAVMGKTGTTNEFRDALFVGSTFGLDGVTVAVRIGFDDFRSLGEKETGARVALPVFRDVMLGIYGDRLVGPAPEFPAPIEQHITEYLSADLPTDQQEAPASTAGPIAAADPAPPPAPAPAP